jgi:virginiamycin A acetyltransferase
MIKKHPESDISSLADLELSKRGTLYVIGARTIIDAFVKFKPAGGKGDITIGNDCVINSGCVFYSGNGISIGDSVAIAANCTLAPVNHEFHKRDISIRSQGFGKSRGGIIIEDDVWIGSNCVLLDGSIIRKGCVIGAGTLIRGEISEYSVVAGNPMKVLGSRE